MCHRMHVTKTSRVEGHAGQELRVGHHVTSLQVLAILHGCWQIGGDQADGTDGTSVRDRVRGRTYIGLDGMSEGIHPCGRRQGLGHADHGLGVVHRQGRGHAPVHYRHLHVASLIGNDAEARHLRTRASRSVDRHHGHHRLGALVHALHLTDVPTIGSRERDGFGAVVWRSASKRDHEVALLRLDHLQTSLHLPAGWVRLAAVVDGVGDLGLLERISQGLNSADLHQHRVCDDEGFLVAQGLDLCHSPFHCPLAHDRLAWHEEGLPFIPRRWMVVVQAMGALGAVPR
mmetsp:Transcript_63030/g.117927  ORF Transcript_63030/g.117927 Transcript_63030/m.117927 type:complete len:287 (+) Transcript_63030:639-1499(+)